MSDTFERLAASAPVNGTAARQLARGEGWNPAVQLCDHYPDQPALKPITPLMARQAGFVNFTGREIGRLKVMGLMDKAGGGPASWVCRCKCGAFCTRTSKSLRVGERGGNSFVPMCGRCDYQAKLSQGWVPRHVAPMAWESAWSTRGARRGNAP